MLHPKILCFIDNDKTVFRMYADDGKIKEIARDVEQISVSSNGHSLMISAKDHKLYGWGSCIYGQLGVDLNLGEQTY